MDLGPHASFIVAAYLATFAIMGALLAWLIYDSSILRRRILELESRGIRRRSAPAAGQPARDNGE